MHIWKLIELYEHPTLIPGTSLQLVMDIFRALEKPIVFRILAAE